MSVTEFIDLCCDSSILKIQVYSFKAENIIYAGFAEDIPSNIMYDKVESYDLPKDGELTINIA